MSSSASEAFPVEGTIKMDMSLFPREVIDRIYQNPALLPRLAISIPQGYTQSFNIETDPMGMGMILEFDFIAQDVKLEES